MTTVAAIARQGVVYMAADTLVNVYERPVRGGVPKIIRVPLGDEELLLGMSGAAALPGILRADLTIQPPAPGADPQLFATHVARAVTTIATREGLLSEGRMEAHLILGWAGQVWSINHSLAVAHHDGIAAIGSGEGPAIGAIDALLACGTDPAEALRRAVKIAARRDKHTAVPVQFERIPACFAAGEVATASDLRGGEVRVYMNQGAPPAAGAAAIAIQMLAGRLDRMSRIPGRTVSRQRYL